MKLLDYSKNVEQLVVYQKKAKYSRVVKDILKKIHKNTLYDIQVK
jgi:hypothetical protein